MNFIKGLHVAIIHVPERPYPVKLVKACRKISNDIQIFTDTEHHGAMWNHLRAIKWAAGQYGTTMILEDDSIPCTSLRTHIDGVKDFIDTMRTPISLVSLYYGKGAPVDAQKLMERNYNATKDMSTDSYGNKYIISDRMYHAVAYMLPQSTAEYLAENLNQEYTSYTAVDLTIQQTLKPTRKYFAYCIPSPIDHNIDLKSTFTHSGARPAVPRTAWEFAR